MRRERSRMDAIDASLVIIGDVPIRKLYEFIAKRQQQSKEKDGYADWLMYSRIMVELSLAIVTYAGNKEKIDAEDSGTKTQLYGKRHRDDCVGPHEEKKDKSEGDGLSSWDI